MRYLFLALPIVVACGCSGSSGSTSWSITTDFTLDESASGATVVTRSGLYFRVQISSEDPDCYSWELSFCDGEYVEIMDHFREGTPQGLLAVWIFRTCQAGRSHIEFDRYACASSVSTGRVTYFLEID